MNVERMSKSKCTSIAAGIVIALVGGSGHAVEIPKLPLQTGTAYPPANVMFILDDSGSMQWRYMYSPLVSRISYKDRDNDDDSSGPTGDNKSSDSDYGPFSTYLSGDDLAVGAYDRSYVTNGIFYNPNVTYLPWMQASGIRMTGGTTYDAVYALDNSVGGTTSDLFDESRPATYYVPKTESLTTSELGQLTNYYRFQIKSNGEVWRAEYIRENSSKPQCDGDNASGWRWRNCVQTTPVDGRSEEAERNNFATWYSYHRTRIKVAKAGAAEAFGQIGSGVRVGYDSIHNRNSLLIPVDTPTESGNLFTDFWNDEDINARSWWRETIEVPEGAGELFVKIENGNGGDAELYVRKGEEPTTDVSDASSAGYGNSETVSIQNPTAGTWHIGVFNSSYSSYWSTNRVRNEDISVQVTAASVSPPNYGLFDGDNKKNWYDKLFAASGSGGTPLRTALKRTGEYYKNSTKSGPWGPETGANQLSCRQSFAILTTDGYWNGDSPSVGNQDGEAGLEIKRSDGTGSFTYAPKTPYKDLKSNTLADVAMSYWKQDLVSGLANNVPSSAADPAFWQHMVTFGVSIGLQGTLNPKTALQSIENGTAWPDPTDNEDRERIDDLWHASVNGRGNFVAASNSDEFVQGLVDALATVAQRLGSASNVTANSTSFQTETRVYQASYVSGKWTGELAAYEVSSAGVSSKDLDGDGLPDAAWRVSELMPDYDDRNVFTWGGSAGAAFPTAGQVTALATTGRAPVDGGPATGAEIADYIKGSSAEELRNGGYMRDRDTVLGDIANSSPIYVEDSKAIFVGANDGMLHAFAATDRSKGGKAKGGQELFAYIPRGVSTAALKSLSNPRYTHSYFVDGPVVVSSVAQTTAAKNYLVGTLGRGGAGLFALDVTDPDGFKATNVLWDYTGTGLPADMADMGRVIGEPLIVKLNDGTDAVIVGNGISVSDSSLADRNAVLFLINLATGAVIKTFDTGADGDNGLAAPRGADINGDRKVDYVYAGDLKGNIWKFDLSGATSADWEIANDGDALFTAVDASGTPQPITAGLAIARDPKTEKVWIFAGTGKFMETGDVTSVSVQSVYGFVDDGSPVDRTDLVERTIIAAGMTADGRAMRGFEENTPIPEDKRGWFIDLDYPKEQGERVVSNPRVQGTVLLVPSMIPPQTGTCEAGGTGFINALDAFTGTSLGAPYFDVNDDGKFDDSDKIEAEDGTLVPVGSIDLGVGMPTLPTLIGKLLVVGGSKGTLGSVVMNPQGGAARRISWRELQED